jgi:uncharacterized coiled-coil protein SlyX
VTAAATSTAAAKTTAMRKGRQADSARRRQRVLDTIARAAAAGEEISVAGIARAAAVDRTFLYRHRDLLEKIHVLETAPPAGDGAPGPGVTRASLQADLLAAGERAVRLTARIRQLEKRLSEALGEQAWHQAGLGAPPDIDALNQKITYLEQETTGLQLQLAERDQDLDAARAASRELMTRLNTHS